MTKKKKQNQSFNKALTIFIVSILLVVGISSCNEKQLPTVIQQANEKNTTALTDKPSTTVKAETIKPVVTTVIETTKPVETTTVETTTAVIPQGDFGDDYFAGENIDIDSLSTVAESCSFKRNSEHIPVTSYIKLKLSDFGAYQLVNTDEKVVYLTFDEGYENGYTESILDTLKANNVQATFFVTGGYIKNSTDLVVRMKEEGHLVGNHSVMHKNPTEITDEELIDEIKNNEVLFEEKTGYEMDTFFRPPEGAFSERSLFITRKLGYRTILWSMAYADWLVDAQKGKEYAYNHVMENYHPGAIILLHAVSSSNAEALDDIIKGLKAEGYRFGNLYEVE